MKRLILIALVLLSACLSELSTVPELSTDPNHLDPLSVPVPDSVRLMMNGVYTVLEGQALLGDEIVGRWINERWCLHSVHDVVFAEFVGGVLKNSIGQDSLVDLVGYIRQVRSGSGVRLGLSTPISAGVPPSLVLRGHTSNGQSIVLRRERAIYNPLERFVVVAHRGGGRNSERLGVSENSIAMLMLSEVLGATGVEIDVKRTRDGHLIVFHDNTFSPRTVQGIYLLGNVGNFDLQQIKQYGRLVNGEPIPTLTEALDAIIDSTGLSYVWLDVKDPGDVDQVIHIQRDVMKRAESKGRDIRILLGIPTQEIMNAYDASSLANTTPILIELGIDKALLHKTCEVWAPRWTNGISRTDIDKMHAAGKRVFVWTLDVRGYIADFLYTRNIDGILSNYPSLVAGMEYSRE